MPDNFFTTKYLFSTTAPTSDLTFFSLLGAYVFLIIVAVFVKTNKKMHRPLRSWVFNYFITIGMAGVFVSLFRSQGINYIGSRMAMLLVILSAVVWYFALLYYSLVKMPKEIKISKNEEKFQRYLPKKKINK